MKLRICCFTALLVVAVLTTAANALPVSSVNWDVTYGDVSTSGNTLTVNPGKTSTQSQGLHGAGFMMSGPGIQFDVDLWTWDSYSKGQGWYDVAFVNINQKGYIFDEAWVDPATLATYSGGEVTNDTTLPGATFAWGGENWMDRNLESIMGSFELSLSSYIPGDPVFVSLGFKTNYDNLFSSGGDFSVTGMQPVPEPATAFLLVTGLAGLAGVARGKKKTQDHTQA